MFRKTGILGLYVFLLISTYGCALLVAGAAGGAGTAAWLSGKLTQEFQSSYESTVSASRKALQSLDLNISKETHSETVTQLRSEYLDGKDIWVDIHRVATNASKVEIRVGGVSPDKEASNKILERIQQYL